tara:strand:- start:983 stop:1327 length:345 start_codon:yes stop_codon:yes gene_type:complete
MKTTVKEYQNKIETRKGLNRLARAHKDANRMSEYFLTAEAVIILDDLYFNKLDTVNVSYWCGYQKFYNEVVVIGKTFFHRGDKMTKSNGFRSVEVIDAITDKMKKQMLDDSYSC